MCKRNRKKISFEFYISCTLYKQKYVLASKIKDIVNTGIIRYTEQENDVNGIKQGRFEYYEWK